MKAKLIIAAAALAFSTAAQAQNWLYSHGPGGTPPAMYNTPYAQQNQQWGNGYSYSPPPYNNQPLGDQRLPAVPCANRDMYGRPFC